MDELLITSEELREILAKDPESVVLLDVRQPEEFAEVRIEGCTLIPLGDLMSRAAKELDPESDIVIYCAHGVRSLHALMGLRSLGFEKLRSLRGGLSDFYGIP